MQVSVSHPTPESAEADLVCVGLCEGEDLPGFLAGAPGAADAKGAYRKLLVLRPEQGGRYLVAGLGKREDLDPERLRCVSALAIREAKGLGAASVAWMVPEGAERDGFAGALTEGSILGDYSFDALKTERGDDEPKGTIDALTILAPEEASGAVEIARVAAEAQNRARDLQNEPSNTATPSYLAERARRIDEQHELVSAEILGPAEIAELGMGGLVAVSQGTAEEPRFIALRYTGAGTGDPVTALVGKGVTFDSGGISIKPSSGMEEMKMDMSGAAAVIETVAAVAELRLPLNLLAVAPCTENMPSGTAIKPGDVITQYNGKTVEVINTDAEGRLILADAIAWCVDQGAARVIDIATLTGAVVVALGSTYCALVSTDDELAADVLDSAERTGELAWRLPLHREYRKLTESKVADLTNASNKRKAGTIYAASFLSEFAGDTPWAHLDIAGTAWGLGRDHVGDGPSGFGVRLLLDFLAGQARA